MTRRLLGAASAAAILLSPMTAMSQGALGVQGLGYPTGQASTASVGMGAASAEADPSSALNPAALASAGRYSVYVQFEPEFRQTRGAGGRDNAATMRFPGFSGTFGYRRFVAGVGFSTLLDRTWTNTYSDSMDVGGVTYPSSLRASSDGAINDARFAASYRVHERLLVGAGIHVLSGENRLAFGRAFPDSTGLGSIAQSSIVNYSGRTFSAGVLARPIAGLIVAASGRFGGKLDSELDNDDLAEGAAPSRYGLGLTWIGIPNTVLSARVDRTAWTDMRDLVSDTLPLFDATEIGFGAEVAGPRLFDLPTAVRLGFRDRELPFGVQGEQVSERSFSGGLGMPLARGRAQLDLALQRSARKAAGVTERSWFVGIGLGIRP